jgi:hypothetical protein
MISEKSTQEAQTGADRMALDWAICHVIPHRGWCRNAGKLKTGPIAAKYL